MVSSSVAWPSAIMRLMNASSCGSTTQPSVSAHQSASSCGRSQSIATWNSYAIAKLLLAQVQVTQQRDLRAVVDHLAVNVQDKRRHRVLGERALGRAAGLAEPGDAETAHAGYPRRVLLVELVECFFRGSWVLEAVPVRGRSAEMRAAPRGEHAHDDVREPPGDRRDRLWLGRWIAVLQDELASAKRFGHRAVRAGADAPAARHRLPEVLLVGQPVQPRAELMLPVPLELADQLLIPVDVHAGHARTQCGQDRSSIAGILDLVMETSARLLRLLSLLQARPDWTGAELAHRLHITARTLRRDVQKLRSLGYPVGATPGVAGGYRLGAGAALPPLLLEDDEAVAVVLGLRTAASHSVTGVAEASVRALAKLEQVLPARLRAQATAISQATVPLTGPGPAVDAETLTTIARACRGREQLRFGYATRDGEPSERRAEPHRLVQAGYRWYLVARDIDRDDWRTFRVDRI